MLLSRTLLVLTSAICVPAAACDLCSLSTLDGYDHGPGWGAGVGLRLTQLDHIQTDGSTIGNPENQYLTSTIVQATVAYQFDDHWSLQAILPYLHRSYRRVEAGEIENGDESGIGDAVIAVTGSLMRGAGHQRYVLLTTVGLKLPTGNSDRLAEEENEVTPIPGATESAVHGHDLALGSGSYDGIFGVGGRMTHGLWFASTDVQYSLRTEGDHHFQYGNDLMWNVGPGYQVWPGEEFSTGIQALISGETKAEDTANGERAIDTALTAWYVGVLATITTSHLTGEVGGDLPISIDNSGTQAVPTWRARASVAYHW